MNTNLITAFLFIEFVLVNMFQKTIKFKFFYIILFFVSYAFAVRLIAKKVSAISNIWSPANRCIVTCAIA